MGSFRLRQTIKCDQRQKLTHSLLVLSTLGDVPLFSLHRIQKCWDKSPPDIDRELSRIFIRNLFERNRLFKKKTGKNWSCVTADGFRYATSDTGGLLQEMINSNSKGLGLEISYLEELKKGEIDKITLWFDLNYDKLIYFKDGKLPWEFVVYLHNKLKRWRDGFEFAFEENISEIAKQFNLDPRYWDFKKAP